MPWYPVTLSLNWESQLKAAKQLIIARPMPAQTVHGAGVPAANVCRKYSTHVVASRPPELLEGPHSAGEVLRAPVRDVVTVHAGEHDVADAPLRNGACRVLRLHLVRGRWRARSVDSAEAAASCARVACKQRTAEHQKSCAHSGAAAQPRRRRSTAPVQELPTRDRSLRTQT